MPYRERYVHRDRRRARNALGEGAGDVAGSTRLVFAGSVVTEGTSVGDSIAVNGCCLTVVDLGPGWWSAEAVEETMRRTNLGGLATGQTR